MYIAHTFELINTRVQNQDFSCVSTSPGQKKILKKKKKAHLSTGLIWKTLQQKCVEEKIIQANL